MKRNFLLAMSVLSCLFFAGCGNTDRDGFVQMALEADSLAVASVQMSDWVRTGDKAVIYSREADTNYTVYRLPAFDSLYSFNAEENKKLGLSTTGILPDARDNGDLYVLDFVNRSLSCFQLEGDSARLLSLIHI